MNVWSYSSADCVRIVCVATKTIFVWATADCATSSDFGVSEACCHSQEEKNDGRTCGQTKTFSLDSPHRFITCIDVPDTHTHSYLSPNATPHTSDNHTPMTRFAAVSKTRGLARALLAAASPSNHLVMDLPHASISVCTCSTDVTPTAAQTRR